MSIIPWKNDPSVPVNRIGEGRGMSLSSLQDEVNRLFEDFFGRGGRIPAFFDEGRSAALSSPAVDISETEKEYKIKAELPGMAPENVDITCGDGYLVIKGEKKCESEEKNENFIRRESSYGSFHRRLSLPDIADAGAAGACFKNGVLTITVPKKEAALKKEKKISIKSAA
jgi:HSP20 family protein